MTAIERATAKRISLVEWADSNERAAAALRQQIETSHPAYHSCLERSLAYRLGETTWARHEAAHLEGLAAQEGL